MSVYHRNISVFNEAYFKNKHVAEMEKHLANFRKSVQSKTIKKQFNSHPDLIKFNRATEKAFGFDYFGLQIIPAVGILNAYTIPISNRTEIINTRSKLTADKEGFKYDNSVYGIMVVAYSDFITRRDITDRECMAVLLHEIGHNFQSAIMDINMPLTFIRKILSMQYLFNAYMNNGILFATAAAIRNTNLISRPIASITETLHRTFPGLSTMIDTYKYMAAGLGYIPRKMMNLANSPLLHPEHYILARFQPDRILNRVTKYNDEKFSDSFATMYGYGVEISSIQLKLEHKSDHIEHEIMTGIPIISPILGLYNTGCAVLTSGLSPHPGSISRIESNIKYLEDELKRGDIDPKVRSEIQKDIKTIRQMLNDTYKTIPSSDDYEFTKKVGLGVMYKIFGTDTPIEDKLIRNNIHARTASTFDKIKLR